MAIIIINEIVIIFVDPAPAAPAAPAVPPAPAPAGPAVAPADEPVEAPDAPAPDAPAESKALTTKKRKKAFNNSLPGPGSATGSGSDDPRLVSPDERLTGAVRLLVGAGAPILPGARSGTEICRFWAGGKSVALSELRPTARFLNSLPASNGAVERWFGKGSELYRDPLRKTSSGEHLLVRVNAHQLGVAGYDIPPVPRKSSESEE